MKTKVILEDWLPRVIGVCIFFYAVYSLAYKQEPFSAQHYWMLSFVVLLVLAPSASRIRILNFIDFNARLRELQQEQEKTNREIHEISVRVTSLVKAHISPTQIQTTIFSTEAIGKLANTFSAMQLAKPMTEAASSKNEREGFLRRAYGFRSRAYTILFIVCNYQLALLKREMGELVVKGDLDDRILYLLNKSIELGIEVLVPTPVLEGASIDDVAQDLRLIERIVLLRKQIEEESATLPDIASLDKMFKKAGEALWKVGMSTMIVGVESMRYMSSMHDAIADLMHEIKQSENENRPIVFPPPKRPSSAD